MLLLSVPLNIQAAQPKGCVGSAPVLGRPHGLKARGSSQNWVGGDPSLCTGQRNPSNTQSINQSSCLYKPVWFFAVQNSCFDMATKVSNFLWTWAGTFLCCSVGMFAPRAVIKIVTCSFICLKFKAEISAAGEDCLQPGLGWAEQEERFLWFYFIPTIFFKVNSNSC